MEAAEASSSLPLPDDLLWRVLSLLPLEALFRLRCVCKQWRSLPFSLLFSDNAASPSPQHHHVWILLFRLLARKVNEHRSSTYKSTLYTFSIAYDRELIGSSGYAVELPLDADPSDGISQESYGVLSPASPVLSFLEAGKLDIVASVKGLLLFALRLSAAHDFEDNSLKLFVYNPSSREVRSLPATRYAPQKLSMAPCIDENGACTYKIYSLGRSYRPGTKYLLYSLEVFDVAEAHHGWQFVNHVRANLSGSGDMHPGTETALMGYVNSKGIVNDLGFLYWMPYLDHISETGWHSKLCAVHVAMGNLYDMPSLLFKTTFAHMWPCSTGVQFVCGVAQGDDLSHTCGVQIWDLLQGEAQGLDDHHYGPVEISPGTRWRQNDQMPQDLWDQLTCKGTRRVACIVSIPLVLVVAESEADHMVLYDVDNGVWKLVQIWPLLQGLFSDQHPRYYKVYPWAVSFTPDVSVMV